MLNQPKHSFHCNLRRFFRWYHNWHNHSLHQDFHWLVFVLIALTLTSFILQTNVNFAYSFDSADIYLAQQDSDPIPGQPIPFQPAQAPIVQNPQATNGFGQMVTNFFNYALILVGISVFIMIMWGGILWLSSAANPSLISTAKRKIFNAIIGAVILLSAYVILRTINPELVGSQLTLPGIKTSVPIVNPPPGPGALSPTDSNILAQFQASGVNVATGIQLAGLRQDTINEVINLKRSCNCNVTITSATGGEHATGTLDHASGYKIDLKLDSGLNNYVETSGNFQSLPTRSDGALMYQRPGGKAIYAKESNHWDIVVRP